MKARVPAGGDVVAVAEAAPARAPGDPPDDPGGGALGAKPAGSVAVSPAKVMPTNFGLGSVGPLAAPMMHSSAPWLVLDATYSATWLAEGGQSELVLVPMGPGPVVTVTVAEKLPSGFTAGV